MYAVVLDGETYAENQLRLQRIEEKLDRLTSTDRCTALAHNPDPLTFISNPQVMEELRVSKATLQRWRDSGRLPFAKVGGIIFYRRRDLSTFLEGHLTATSAR